MKELNYQTEKIKELERRIKKLEGQVSVMERWMATHHCRPLPPNIERVIGIPLPDKNTPIIPSVEI